MVDERLTVFRAVVGMDGLAGLFVDEQNVLVLIDNIELRYVNREVGVFLLGGVKKLVVDIELDRIAEMEPRIAFCSLAVDFNALEAGSSGTDLETNRSRRWPSSFLPMESSFISKSPCQNGAFLYSNVILSWLRGGVKRGLCGNFEKRQKFLEKAFDFPAFFRYNIHRTIMDWRALCCWNFASL